MTKMSALSLINNFLILPPKVYSEKHGECEFTIDAINWTTTKSFPLVDIGVHFWGENLSEGNFFRNIKVGDLGQKNNHKALQAKYQINTSYRLFLSYLRNCDDHNPIYICLHSSKSSELIGLARVSISKHHLSSLETNSQFKLTSQIVNSRNFKLGDLSISIAVNFDSKKKTMVESIKTKSERELEKDQLSKKRKEKKTMQIVGSSKLIVATRKEPLPKVSTLNQQRSIKIQNTIHQNRKNSTSTSKSASTLSTIISDKKSNGANKENMNGDKSVTHAFTKSSIIDYLCGKSLTTSEEENILSNLNRLSPSHSLLEEINKFNCMESSTNPRHNSISNEINSIQITINTLELNSIGFTESKYFVSKLQNAKFVYKCVITSKLFKKKENVNFISTVFDVASQSE
jgi:hypothetical protein